MTAIIETEKRPVLVTPLTELHRRSGGIVAALATGALIRLDENRVGRVAGLIVPPKDVPRILAEFYGIDPAGLPEPGSVRDAV